jgi:RNA polymerase sigma factor (sigma-70 family)
VTTLTGAACTTRASYTPQVTSEHGSAIPRATLDVERLYAESFPRVSAFAFRLLGDRDAALDAAQDSFAIALEQAQSFRGESAPLTWLLSITKNLCLSRLRGARRRRFEDIEAIVDRCSEPPSAAYSALERRFYVEAVKEGCLVGLLRCLPVSQRCVFVLCLLNDLPITDVGRIMGKTENSIRILLSRARAKMRAFLCRNCSLLGDGVRCSCANMIEFSLKRGLVERYRPLLAPRQVEDELRRFSDEVELYRSLPDPPAAIARLLASGRYAVLAERPK